MINNLGQADFEKVFKQHLKIEPSAKSIHSLFGPRFLNKVNYKPYYQRNYVWDNNKASYFIESILLGTEIPPLIFFNNNTNIEVIDGRQRFETIKRFMNNEFALTEKGLTVLKKLKKKTYDDLAKLDSMIIESFLDANIRIIEFALVNEPPLDKFLEDRIKKEIFSRYNSGITPLKKSEIDNAVYDTDLISVKFKKLLKEDKEQHSLIFNTFFTSKTSMDVVPKVEQTLSFIRRFLVLHKFPIKTFAFGNTRTETLTKLYEFFSDTVEDDDKVIEDFLRKLLFINQVKVHSEGNGFAINRLALESFVWGLMVAETEEFKVKYDQELVTQISEFISENIQFYKEFESHFADNIILRYKTTATFFEQMFNTDLSIYINSNAKKRAEINSINTTTDTIPKISELESLRLNKPEPSKKSIEDIRDIMQRRRYLLRPSYQRAEVINIPKASSIIESILLGIVLPPIFVYKREDGVNEVIDGQQRLLTILAYIGSEYIDENNNQAYSKNHKFSVRHPRILKEISGLKFHELPEAQRDKILDFQLYIVTIEEKQNPDFNPIDLFIRLNDKPFPIREHSFEMWNSWVDFEVIAALKNLTAKVYPWFYIKQLNRASDRDRMENEELLCILVAFAHFHKYGDLNKYLDIYQINERINARVSNKNYISQLLMDVTAKPEVKAQMVESIKSIELFIRKLKYVLLDCDKPKEELTPYLKSELDMLFKADNVVKYGRRTMQEFYFAWYILKDINFEMVKFHRLEMKKEIKSIYAFLRELPSDFKDNNAGFNKFLEMLEEFKLRYQKDERKIRLTEQEKFELIKQQQGKSSITGAPIFLGDDLEIDHYDPLAIGGKDEYSNLRAVHSEENRSKGAKSIT